MVGASAFLVHKWYFQWPAKDICLPNYVAFCPKYNKRNKIPMHKHMVHQDVILICSNCLIIFVSLYEWHTEDNRWTKSPIAQRMKTCSFNDIAAMGTG